MPGFTATDAHARPVRSNAPSPENHPKVTPIDTSAPKKEEQKLEWVAFDVRDFEDREAPLMFLDSFTQKHYGWPMIRSKAMIPEKYIERLPSKSPCLSHGHGDGETKESFGTAPAAAAEGGRSTDDVDMDDADVFHDAEAELGNAAPAKDDNDGSLMDVVDESGEADEAVKVSAEADTEKPVDEIDWDNDPAYQYFCRRLNQQKHLRQHRLHPVSRYQSNPQEECKGCREMIIPLLTDKIVKPKERKLNGHDWHVFKNRYQKALNMLHDEDHDENRNCPICKESLRRIEGTISEHWAIHHNNFVHNICEYRDFAKAGAESSDSELKFESLIEHEVNPAEVEEGALWTREEFCYIEKLCCYAENEVLQREEYCRLCYQTFEFGDPALADHYEWHSREEQLIRSLVNKHSERVVELLDNELADENAEGSMDEETINSNITLNSDGTINSNDTINGKGPFNERQLRARAAILRAAYERKAENRRRTKQFNTANMHQINLLQDFTQQDAETYASELLSPILHNGLFTAVKWPGSKNASAKQKKLAKKQKKASIGKAKAAALVAEAAAEFDKEEARLAKLLGEASDALAEAEAEVERRRVDLKTADARVAATDITLADDDEDDGEDNDEDSEEDVDEDSDQDDEEDIDEDIDEGNEEDNNEGIDEGIGKDSDEDSDD